MTVDWEGVEDDLSEGQALDNYRRLRQSASAMVKTLLDLTPGMKDVLPICPVDDDCQFGFIPRTVAMMVMHLNDSHEWTREQIAEWLDMLHRMGHDLSLHTGEEEDR